jgi:hypothetical protein
MVHICVGVPKGELMVRVGEAHSERALVRPMNFTGRDMRGIVYVASEGLGSAAELGRWLRTAAQYVRTLPAHRASRLRRKAAAKRGAASKQSRA